LGAAILLCSSSLHLAYAKPFMIVGIDQKVLWDDDGKTVLSAPGKDSVLIVDLASPENPKIVATLPLKNSVIGPPVNLDIDPSGSVALVADSRRCREGGRRAEAGAGQQGLCDRSQGHPPKLAGTVTAGKQPSG
jgi:hypothetical protein